MPKPPLSLGLGVWGGGREETSGRCQRAAAGSNGMETRVQKTQVMDEACSGLRGGRSPPETVEEPAEVIVVKHTRVEERDGDGMAVGELPSTPPQSRSSSRARGRSVSSPSARSPRSASSSRASSPRPKNYLCDFPGCSKAYSRPSLLEQHVRTHYGYRPFKCRVQTCEESFMRKDHLERHMLKHVGEKDKPFHCSVCGRGVNSKQHLKRHEKTHYKSFVCTYNGCSESFHKHQSLKAHIRAIHEGLSGHVCRVCGKQFNRPSRLVDHMEKHHSETAKLMCDFPGCYQAFRVWSALQLHVKTEHPRLKCEVCGKKCVGATGLANHMKIHDENTVIKLWKCVECGEKFHKKEDTVRHFAERHPLLELPEELQYTVKDEKERALKLGKVQKHKRGDSIQDATRLSGSDTEPEPEAEAEAEIEAKRKLSREDNETLSDCGFIVSSPTHNGFKRHQTNRIPSSPDVLDLIIDNVDMRLHCPYTNCHRLFRKDYDLQRHLSWHEKQDHQLEKKVGSILSEYSYNSEGELVKTPTQESQN